LWLAVGFHFLSIPASKFGKNFRRVGVAAMDYGSETLEIISANYQFANGALNRIKSCSWFFSIAMQSLKALHYYLTSIFSSP
jgi:hypothetical protein